MKKLEKPIYVTNPILPELCDLMEFLKLIWNSKILTNMGTFHSKLETKLIDELRVKNVSLFNNGTIALLTAIKALDLPYGSEVITTPFTFAATPHCISWNGLKPVFCDIEPDTMCIDPDKIESLITPDTSAILGVHVYGFPCKVEKIQKIADKYGLKVIYDAAHAFSCEINGRGIGEFGDISMFSFHATKLFNTIEGGCLTYNNENLIKKIYNLRNFGIQSEDCVEDIGINGKMNELQASIGLLNLKIYKKEQEKRAKLKKFYDDRLSLIEGIKLPKMPENVSNSYQYYPIIVEDNFNRTRDDIYKDFREKNVFSRKYFYPLCSDYECYKHLESSHHENLKIANKLKNQVLCLPFYGDLSEKNAEFIVRELEK